MKIACGVVLPVLLLLCSCEVAKDIRSDVYLHSLTVDGDGTPQLLNVQRSAEQMSGPEGERGGDGATFRSQIEEMQATKGWQEATDVVIYLHGGLNSLDNGIRRTSNDWQLLQQGMAKRPNEPDRVVYPVFINWESGAFNGYADHLLWYRGGESRWWGPLTSPLVFAVDFVRAIGTAPLQYLDQMPDLPDQFGTYSPVKPPQHWADQVGIVDAVDQPTVLEVRDFATFWTLGWFRPFTLPLAQMVLGEAYPLMERRVDTLFTTDEDLGDGCSSSNPTGALHELCTALAKKPKVNGKPVRVLIIAHSMGTMAANRILSKYPDLDYREVVYMGAACSIEDFAASVPARLRAKPDMTFFNVCLHPHGDRRENLTLSLMPYGSLLEWLDKYVYDPQTKLEKTLGKFNNIVSSLDVLQPELHDVMERVFIKSFPIDKANYPNCHGAFDDFSYWLPGFWDPACEQKPLAKPQTPPPPTSM